MHVVQLNEVVRNSARIMEAAADFRSRELKERPTSHHQSAGVPLKSILFDLNDTNTYEHKTIEALNHVVTTFPSLRPRRPRRDPRRR